jgi:hypothetical protein
MRADAPKAAMVVFFIALVPAIADVGSYRSPSKLRR